MNATCDTPAPLTNFNGAAYMGTWYEQQHVKNQFFQADDSTCTEATYSGLTADGHFKVHNTSQDANFGPRTGITGEGYCPDASGQCFVTFYVEPTHTNYQVIDTDYKTYSVVYACGPFKSFLWFLSREPTISDTLYNKMLSSAKAKLPKFNFANLNTRDYQGSKCSYTSNFAEFLQ